MDNLDFIIGVFLALLASIARGLSGFGSAMILTPGLTMLFDPQEVIVTVILLELIATIILLPNAIPETNWSEILPMSLAAIFMIPIGTILLNVLNANFIQMLIGILLFGTVLILMKSEGYKFNIKPNFLLNISIGACSGFLTSLTSMGGIPIVIHQFLLNNSATEKRATFISFFAFTQIITFLFYVLAGLVSFDILQMFFYLCPIFIIGLFSGQFLFSYIKEKSFNNLIIYLLLVMSLLALSPSLERLLSKINHII